MLRTPAVRPRILRRLGFGFPVTLFLAILSFAGCAAAFAAQATPIEEGTGTLHSASEASAASAVKPVEQHPVAVPTVQIPSAGVAAAPVDSGLPIVALLDFESTTLDRKEVEALSQALWSQLDLSGRVRMLPRQATRRWLIANDLFPFLPYGPRVELPMVASRLRAKYLVTGVIDRVQGAYAVELKVHDDKKPEPILKDAGTKVASLQEMLATMHALAGETLQVIAGGSPSAAQATPGTWAQTSSFSDKRTVASAASDSAAIKTASSSKTKVKKASGRPVAQAEEEPVRKTPAPVEKTPGADSEKVTVLPEPVVTATPTPAATPKAATRVGTGPTPVAPPPAAKATPKPVQTPAVTATPAAHVADPADAQNLYQEALALPVKDESRLSRLERAAKLAPENALINQQLAFDYFQRGRYADCASLCDKALAQAPKDSKLLMIKGSAQISLSQWKAAAESCRAAVEADKTNNYARYNMALALEMDHSPEAAAAWRDYLTQAANDPQHQGLLPEARQRLDALEKKQ